MSIIYLKPIDIIHAHFFHDYIEPSKLVTVFEHVVTRWHNWVRSAQAYKDNPEMAGRARPWWEYLNNTTST